MNTTPVSLLERLRQPNEPASWQRFVQLYTPLLFHWARRQGLPEDEAGDLVQDVFVVLLKELPKFEYQAHKRFRAWLWTVLLNKWRERCRRAEARPRQIGDAALVEQAVPDGAVAIEEEEYRKYLAARALELMQAEFQPSTWKACWEYAVVGRPAAQVAAELGVSVNAVRLAASRVLRRVRPELARLFE